MPPPARFSPLLVIGLLFAGCDGEVNFRGYDIHNYFPLDGSRREWAYENEDPDQDWTLLVEKWAAAGGDDLEIVTLETSHAETGDVLNQILWSSDSLNGVLLHGYQDILGGGPVVRFSEPVVFGAFRMVPGDTITSVVDGHTITSTLEHMQRGCETDWAPYWYDATCLKITVQDRGKAAAETTLFTGSYWLVYQYGVAWMELDRYQGRWTLSSAAWQE